MRLLKKKPRANRRSNTRNETGDPVSKPASSPFKTVNDGRKYLVDLQQHPRYAEHWRRYWEALRTLADQLVWFGQEPYAPAKTVNRENLKKRTLPSVRRLLVSFQVGRPISEIAARVPCSSQTVYKILNELFYRRNGNLASWIELGLVAVWDGPEVDFDPTMAPGREQFWEDAAPIFCLMCHRPIDHARLYRRDHDSTLVRPDDGRYRAGHESHRRALGHMISHFYLGGRPKPNEPSQLLEHAYVVFGGLAGNLNARMWRNRVPPGAVIESQRWRNQPPPPVIQGRSPTRESVIQYYRDLL